jgi:hypothetical protein
MAGHHDHGEARPPRADLLLQGETIHVRHLDVEEEAALLAGRAVREECRRRSVEADREAGGFEKRLKRIADVQGSYSAPRRRTSGGAADRRMLNGRKRHPPAAAAMA